MKVCAKCKEKKSLSEFYFRKDTNKYRNECKKCFSNQTKQFKNDYPWRTNFYSARRRCNNKTTRDYKWYGAKGIEFFLTIKDVKFLWYRDRAYLMKQPSIDRKDNDENYILKNCKFMELKNNTEKSRIRKSILQFDLEGNFIREWKSLSDASKKLNCKLAGISNVLTNRYKTSGGFIWRYKQ